MKKILGIILGIILVISISLTCLFTAVELNTFNLDFYNKSFEKYGVDVATGKSFEELEAIAIDLTLYLDDKASEEIMEPNFNETEISHMVDVKKLFIQGKLIRNISVFLTVAIALYFFIIREKKYLKFVFIGLFVNWIILIALGLMVYIDFNKYFIIFHEIFFSNELWLLDPETDLLIQMLPEGFFVDIAVRIILLFVAFLIIIQSALLIFMRRNKDKIKSGMSV